MQTEDDMLRAVDSFESDLQHISDNFRDIVSKKYECIRYLSKPNLTDDQIKHVLYDLRRLQTKQRRYFKLVRKHFEHFHFKVKEINSNVNRESGQARKYEKMIGLTKTYFATLLEICKSTEHIMLSAEDKMMDEERHLKRASGSIFIKRFKENFVTEYKKYLDAYEEELRIEMEMESVKGKYSLLGKIGREIELLAKYDKKKLPAYLLVAVGLIIGLASHNYLILLGDFIFAAGIIHAMNRKS
jgi:hypothetical protein